MKPSIAATAAITLLAVSTAQAQTANPPPRQRGDAVGVVGWNNVDREGLQPDLDFYDEWANRIAFAGGGIGYYWTDHLKTELDAGASSRTSQYAQRRIIVDGREEFGSAEFEIGSHRLALSQHYQFYRNVFFHPHVGAGVDLTWRTTARHDQPISRFDQVTRQSRLIAPDRSFPSTTELLTRPFAEVGFKAYMTPRAFFRMDMRLVFRNSVDEVLMRFGVGADF